MLDNINEIGKTNQEYINKYTPQQWIEIMKELYIQYDILIKKENIETVRKANNYKVTYDDGKIFEISFKINFNDVPDVEIVLTPFSIIFNKPIGGGQYKAFNYIPITTFTIMNNINNN